MDIRHLLLLSAGAIVGMWLTVPATYARSQVEAHHHPDAAVMQNPVKPDAESIASGKKLYGQYCAECHGEMGRGDGPRAPYTDPKPPDLTDAEWKHGATEGEIFAVIRDGVDGTEMPAFGEKGEKLPERQLWDIVNFVRSLGPSPQAR